jgi:hypothetical protein
MLGFTMTTKRQLIEAAHAELGLADYVFDVPAEQLQLALRRLNGMMAEWDGMGLRLGFPIPGNVGGGDLDTEAGVPDRAWEAISLNLAIRLAPQFGKQVSPETMTAAKRGFNMLLGKVVPGEMSLGRTIAGAGNKPLQWNLDPFLPEKPPALDVGPDGALEFE